MNALEFFLKANLYLALFYACYHLGLRRHTFFGLNRAYLLASVVAALTLPLVELSMQTVEQLPVPVGVITLPVTALAVAAEPTGPDWETLGYWAYGLVALGLFLRLLLRLLGLGRMIARSERVAQPHFTLVRPESEKVPSFSFFRYLVLNTEDARHHADVVCRHELVHIRQWHSADVLFFELVQLLFWINPVMLLYQRAIRQVHEFLADRGATTVEDSTQYATFLVEYAFSAQPDTLTNSFFNPSLLKERILMLHRRATSRRAVWKYALVPPLALGLLAMTSAPEEVGQLVASVTAEEITVTGRVTDSNGRPLPGANVVIVGATRGTTTDAQGDFQLSNIPADGKLAVSFIGFKTQEVAVKGRKTLSVQLQKAREELKEVVVVGYGTGPEAAPAERPARVQPSRPAQSDNQVFKVVEQQPEFPGGLPELYKYLSQNIRYPARARQANVSGIVLVQFVVSETGRVQNIQIMKGIGFGCDAEAVRLVSEINQLQPWQPGKQNGKPVPVEYVLPITFSLEKSPDKRSGYNETPKLPENLRLGDFPDYYGKATSKTSMERIADVPMPRGFLSIPSDTIDLNEPLYVLDGVVQKNKRAVRQLDPKTITSISVLKGETARQFYGLAGKNGVILISTKETDTDSLRSTSK